MYILRFYMYIIAQQDILVCHKRVLTNGYVFSKKIGQSVWLLQYNNVGYLK